MAVTETLRAVQSIGISSSSMDWADRSSNSFMLANGTGQNDRRQLLVKFSAPSPSNLYREILSATFHGYVSLTHQFGSAKVYFYYLTEQFNPDTTTYRTRPDSGDLNKQWSGPLDQNYYGYISTEIAKGYGLSCLLKYGLNAWSRESNDFKISMDTSRSSNYPYLTVTFGEPLQTEIYSTSPARSEVINRADYCNFSVRLSTHGFSVGTIKPLNTTVKWRQHGTSDVHTQTATGSEVSVNPNTLPEGQIDYSVSVEVSNGQTLTSEWITFTVVAPKLRFESTSPSADAMLNKSKANIFSFSVSTINELHPGDITITTGKFRWRTKGNSQINELDFNKELYNISVPANTFVSADYEYSFHIVTNYNQTLDSDWVPFSTKDTIPTVRLLRPDGGMEDANKAISLAWVHVNASGTLPTKADINLLNEDTQETFNYVVNGSETSYVIPKETLSSGTYSWKVRSYNIDGVSGTWSTPYKFVVVGAPPAPPVILEDNSPRPVISWQPREQAGYQIQVDDEPVESYYGLQTSWRCGKYLPDGPHRIRVRVQNKFSLWSTWQTVTVNVKNIPGETFLMYDDCFPSDFTPQISWDVRKMGYDFVLIYRNGIPIAKFNEPYGIFMDYNVSGTPVYFVRAGYNDSGNYCDAFGSPYGVPSYPHCPVIRALEDTDWLELPLSDDQYREFSLRHSHKVNTYRLAGHEYPVCSPTMFKSKKMSFTAASDDKEWKARLEGMDGKIVCVKLPSGDSIIGPIDLAVRHSEFYSVYSINIYQIDFKEEIPLDS